MSDKTCAGCRSPEIWHYYEDLFLCCRCAPNCPAPDRLVVAIAADHRQFERWCYDQGFNPRRPHIIYLSEPWRARGISRIDLVRIGNWYSRRDLYQINDCLLGRDVRMWRAYRPEEKE